MSVSKTRTKVMKWEGSFHGLRVIVETDSQDYLDSVKEGYNVKREVHMEEDSSS